MRKLYSAQNDCITVIIKIICHQRIPERGTVSFEGIAWKLRKLKFWKLTEMR